MENQGEQISVSGTVTKIIYSNDLTGFKIFSLAPKEKIFYNNDPGDPVLKDDDVVVMGTTPTLTEDVVVKISGHWKWDDNRGWQIQIESAIPILPTSTKGIEQFLASGLIKGIGPAMAKRIVKKFGKDSLTILDEDPDKLLDVKGLGPRLLGKIIKSWAEQKCWQEIITFLAEYDISAKQAMKIHKALGDKAIEMITTDPYCLVEAKAGIGFKMADQIARKMGVASASVGRIRSAIIYVLQQATLSGHCFLYNQELWDGIKRMNRNSSLDNTIGLNEVLNLDQPANQFVPPDIAWQELCKMVDEKLIYREQIHDEATGYTSWLIYLPQYYHAEQNSAKKIIELMYNLPFNTFSETEMQEINKAIADTGIQYDDLQKEAILQALTYNVFILTGGPGTGKTTTTRGILDLLEQQHKEILLAAPTGRAAQRLSETTGREASTIHRLLEYTPSGEFGRNEDNPLDGDVLLLDECSMADLQLFYSLLKAIPEGMALILVGDVDQLPSVGAGAVLRDLIDSRCFPCVQLTKVFRQAESSLIIQSAHAINHGIAPTIPAFGADSDCTFVGVRNGADAEEAVLKYISEIIPSMMDIKPTDIQVLAPQHKGACGVDVLNKRLQEIINPRGQEIKGAGGLRLGDKVMQMKNDYTKNVFNGTVGFIKKYDEFCNTVTINFDGEDVEYDFTDLDQVELAYASTIHKSQGSEYPVVILPIVMDHRVMLKRNLVYTAITRAKQNLVIIGQPNALMTAITTTDASMRNTFLKQRCQLAYFAYKKELQDKAEDVVQDKSDNIVQDKSENVGLKQ